MLYAVCCMLYAVDDGDDDDEGDDGDDDDDGDDGDADDGMVYWWYG